MNKLEGIIRFPLRPDAIRGVTRTDDGRLHAVVEMFRPGVRINQFMPTPEFVANTIERWTVDGITDHKKNSRADAIVGTIERVEVEAETGAVLGHYVSDPTPLGQQLAYQIEQKRAAFSIGAADPELAVDPHTTPEPWDLITASPDHLMITRLGHQAQPDAQVRGIYATGKVKEAILAAGGQIADPGNIEGVLSHNSTVAETEPGWGEWLNANRSKLPDSAFADAEKRSRPHHFVVNGSDENADGRWTDGDMFLHRGGLTAAWASAQGARTGERAPQPEVDHLSDHRDAIGLEGALVEMDPAEAHALLKSVEAWMAESELEPSIAQIMGWSTAAILAEHEDGAHRESSPGNLSRALNSAIEKMESDDLSRGEIIMRMARAAGIGEDTVRRILSGRIDCPPIARIRAFARVLSVSFSTLRSAGVRDDCPYDAEAALKRWQITVQGANPETNEDNMNTEEEKKALEAKLEESSAKLSDLDTKIQATEAERDEWKAKVEAADKQVLTKSIHDLEGRLGKPEDERTDTKEMSVDDVRALEAKTLREFADNPPKLRDRVDTSPPPQTISAEADPAKDRNLFGRSGKLHSAPKEGSQ